ncbi:MAG: AzlD domain-containing protein [Desulfovibrionaceae bacterium]|nr:AzlD domain-containing protein [Desulfovibrionaceae bacterium]
MTDLTSPANLLLLLVICIAVTVVPRVLPLFVFSRQTPEWLSKWLNFVPAAVMAALVVPDLFFYNGSFSLSIPDNLYLTAGIVTVIFCIITKNFVGTILFGMIFVAGMRWFGLAC